MKKKLFLKITEDYFNKCKNFIKEHPETGYSLERLVVNYYPLVKKGLCPKKVENPEYIEKMIKKHFIDLDYSI